MADGPLTADELHRAAIDADDVWAIAEIDADLVRTRAISVAYHLLGRKMEERLELRGLANWWTFATWATITIAFAIDPTDGWQPQSGPPRQASFLKRHVLPKRALTVSNRFLAQANRYVFYEMALVALAVIDAADELRHGDDDALAEFLETVEPMDRIDIFGRGRSEVLHHGIAALVAASRATDRADARSLLHVSNVALFEYEQRRLQGYLEVLLSGRPLRRWAELRNVINFDTRTRTTTFVERARGRASTRFMKMQLPDAEIRLADRRAVAASGRPPVNLSPADERYLSRWELPDRTTFARRRARAEPVEADWQLLRWRMARIGTLFEARLEDEALRRCPYDDETTLAILHGVDPRNNGEPPLTTVDASTSDHRWTHASLDELRTEGDSDVGLDVPGVAPGRTRNPGLSELAWPLAVDRWVKRHRHLTLTEMLSVVLRRHPVERETIDDIIDAQLMQAPPERLDWVSDDDVARARSFFRMRVPAIGTGLVFGSLPADLAAADGARVVYLSGFFLADAPRRIHRTTRFVFDVMNTGVSRTRRGLGEPEPVCACEERSPFSILDGPTIGTIRRTRVTHQVVRSWMAIHESAHRLDPWGPTWPDGEQPINVEDQIGTILSFTTALWDAMRNLGVDPDLLAEYEAPWYRTWCLVGVNLGIPAEHLPRSVDDARELAHLLASRHLRPSQAGFELGQTLVRELRRALPFPINVLPLPIARRFTAAAIQSTTRVPEGDHARYPWSISEMLALPESRWLRPGLANRLLRTTAGEGEYALPRTMVNERIVRHYTGPAPRYGQPTRRTNRRRRRPTSGEGCPWHADHGYLEAGGHE